MALVQISHNTTESNIKRFSGTTIDRVSDFPMNVGIGSTIDIKNYQGSGIGQYKFDGINWIYKSYFDMDITNLFQDTNLVREVEEIDENTSITRYLGNLKYNAFSKLFYKVPDDDEEESKLIYFYNVPTDAEVILTVDIGNVAPAVEFPEGAVIMYAEDFPVTFETFTVYKIKATTFDGGASWMVELLNSFPYPKDFIYEGELIINITVGDTFVEPVVTDEEETAITPVGTVDDTTVGTYTLVYSARNYNTLIITVNVEEVVVEG